MRSIQRRPGSTSSRSPLVPALIAGLCTASFFSVVLFQIQQQSSDYNPIRDALSTSLQHPYLKKNHKNNNPLDETHHLPPGSDVRPVRNNAADVDDDEQQRDDTEETDDDADWDENLTREELIRTLYPNETAIPNPPMEDGNSTFASCLLVMDDNHRLTEWLAYHYHVLPLRYLIVAVDPRSKTSPTHILNQWRAQGVFIEEWTDVDFWRSDLKEIPEDAVLQTKRDRHRGRQKFFYKKCLIRCKRDARTWVGLHDSDEYLVYNHKGGAGYAAWETNRIVKHRKAQPRIVPSQTPPTTAEEGGMIRYIEQERAAGLQYYKSPCIGIPRLMFGADERKLDPDQLAKPVPDALRHLIPSMDTIKYRQHATRNDFVKNALGKVILDVSRVDVKGSPYFQSLHRPIKTICSSPWHNDWESGLRINHYLGSWESYSFRDDSRRGNERSLEQWEYKATTLGENTDDNIRPWLGGFVESQGLDRAERLLQHVGLPVSYKNRDVAEWKLNPEKLKAILTANQTESSDNKVIAFEEWVRNKYRNLKMSVA